MTSYKAYCFDLDGTVYKGDTPIPEAIAFIHKLQEQGIEPFYITNNSSKTAEQLQQKLQGCGVKSSIDHIMTSALATAKYIKTNHPNASVQMIGEDGLREALQTEGIAVKKEDADVFVLGIDRQISYEKLMNACFAIQNGAKFIATNSDKAFPNERGFAPGNGSFATLIETVTGITPLFVGKPASHMLQIIQQQFGFQKEEMVMIGDNYDTDILSGIQFGIDTAHVNTGVTSTQNVQQQKMQPTYLLESLANW